MGSPSSRLNTAESLRPWVESGLEFVFQPGRLQSVGQQQLAQTHSPAPNPHTPPQQARQQVQAPQQGLAPQPPSHAPQQAHQGQQPVAQPNVAPPMNPGFPEPWATFFACVPASPTVLWTYMELGLDLGGQADQKRGGVLRNLINHLKWPKGTTAFWPVAALANNSLQPNQNMFWKGWSVWKTQYIVCFGREALRVILPDADAAVTTHFLQDVTIYVLPSLSKLMTMLPHEQQLSIDHLTGIRV